MSPWLKEYQTREWQTHKLEFASPEYQQLRSSLDESDLFICGSDSEAAKSWWERDKSVDGLLFFDAEQILGMGLEGAYGVGDFGTLNKEWMGYPVGSLVMGIFKGVNEQPPCLLIGVSVS